MPRAQVTLPFADALAANTVSASLVISNMDAEGDGMDSNSTVSVRGSTPAQWEAAVRRAFTAWPGGGSAVAEALLSAYAEEAAIDPQLAYDAINTDFGLTCAAQALGARLARGSLRTRPVYLLYNAMPRSHWAPSGAARWPSHGLDLEELGWEWSFVPAPSDLAESALMLRLLGDFGGGGGVMPASWDWPPVGSEGAAVATLVLAVDGVWPYGGAPNASVLSNVRLRVQVESEWRSGRCSVLERAGFDERYWWCD